MLTAGGLRNSTRYDHGMLRPTYPLETERLILRPYTAGDLDSFHAILRRDDVSRYLYSEPRDRDEARDLLARVALKTAIDDDHDDLLLAVLTKESGAIIGHVTLERTSREHRQGEIGYVLHPDHQGHGYATEAASVMLRLGFEALGFHRIVGRLDARNAASARVLERLGMRREAHLRENEFIKGEWCDELVYAMLATEWPARGDAGDA
jgi:RimJ/RimL family protein N-acetyltransferase